MLLLAWVVTAGVAYGATVFQKSLNVNVNVVEPANFEFYSDQAATQVITDIYLEDVEPGETSTFTVYIKNIGSVTETVTAGPNSIPASVGALTLTFNGRTSLTLSPGATARIAGTLRVLDNAPAGPIDFTFTVNSTPSTSSGNPTSTPTTTTTSTPTATTLSGQQIFSTYCLTCHSSLPGSNRTQSQLVNFISGHQTGASLTTNEVAAIAAFLAGN